MLWRHEVGDGAVGDGAHQHANLGVAAPIHVDVDPGCSVGDKIAETDLSGKFSEV